MAITDEMITGAATLDALGEVVFKRIILIAVTIAGVRSIVDSVGRWVADDSSCGRCTRQTRGQKG